MSGQWRQHQERGSPAALRLILWIALHLGRRVARFLLLPITLYFFLTSARARRASRQFLSRARGRPASAPEVFRHLLCFAATILDRVYLLGGRHEGFDVRIHGIEQVVERLRAGQGCILMGAHLGSFEILRTWAIEQRETPLKILMHKEHNRTVTQLLDALNPEIAASVIDLGRPDCLLHAKEWVDGGGVLGLLGDRVISNEKAVRCDFLGRPALFPPGPMLLASALKAPVILVFGLYRGGNRYDVYMELFSETVGVNRRRSGPELQQLVQAYADRLAHYARLAPYNWFNFYDFWQHDSDTGA